MSDTCSLVVTVDKSSGKAVKLKGNDKHPITKGFHIIKLITTLILSTIKSRSLSSCKDCSKGSKGKFKKYWDYALKLISKNIKTNLEKYGGDSIQPYSYSGTLGMLGYWGMSERFWNKVGASRWKSNLIAAASTAGIYAYGAAYGPAIDEVPKNDLIILWGTNVASTHVHMVPFLEEAKKNGARICIDPEKLEPVS